MGCKTESLRSPPTSNFSREAEFETVGTGIENVLAGFAVRIKTADLDDITSSGKKGRYQFRLPIQTAIRQCQPCCMDHPEGCLIIVFFNTGDNLDAT